MISDHDDWDWRVVGCEARKVAWAMEHESERVAEAMEQVEAQMVLVGEASISGELSFNSSEGVTHLPKLPFSTPLHPLLR